MTERVEELRGRYRNHGCAGDTCTDTCILLTALAQAERSMYAYAGALGYAIPGDQDGRLPDGTFPKCGLCEAKDQQLAQAERERDEAARMGVEMVSTITATLADRVIEITTARAEVERLTGENRRLRSLDRDNRATLARVRAALQAMVDLHRWDDRAGVVEEARAALEGRG